MHSEGLILSTAFIGFFLVVTSLILTITKKIKFPYTVALLIGGFILQLIFQNLGFDPHFSVTSNVIYFVLLPLLLFESAFQINFHQFKLQFKSITFLATFGMLLAAILIAGLLSHFIGIGFWNGLLFGSLISATDPIAVLAIFKELGAPKRLALIAEGESMFNDATAVIVFRLIASFVVLEQTITTPLIAKGVLDFSIVFTGSLLFGYILAYLTSVFIAKIDNEKLIETTMTVALSLLSFILAEHFLGLSGVIACVAAGITMGNVGRTKISTQVITFMEQFWHYIGFVAISLVFFFTAFDLSIDKLFAHPEITLYAVVIVLIARAISVYVSFGITNSLKFFKNEPNVPLKWQHVLNWGGLRGVIPLVLVYSLPETYQYKEQFLVFTLASFLFSLLINGLTIKKLLFLLNLHLPKKEEEIIQKEADIFSIQSAKEKITQLPKDEFSVTVVKDVLRKLHREETRHKNRLEELAVPKDFEKSLRIEALQIERKTLQDLFDQQHINEAVFYQFQSEIDIQQDAIEYPDLYYGQGYESGGLIQSKENFYTTIEKLSKKMMLAPILSEFLETQKEKIVIDRLSLLQARIVASGEVISYLQHIKELVTNKQNQKIIDLISSEHEQYRLKNNFQIQAISREFPRTYTKFETKMVETLAWQT